MSRFAVILLYFCFCLPLYTCKTFGFNNFYTCHCEDNINCNENTGQCAGSNCQRGWSGPSCQKQNVALDKPADQINTIIRGKSSLAVDGNRNNILLPNLLLCINTDFLTNPWWRVDLQQTFPIRDINIVNRNPHINNLIGFEIDVETDDGRNTTCYQHTGDVSTLSYNYTAQCNSTIDGRYVTISVPGIVSMTLCEVEVNVCSVGTYGDDCNSFCHCTNNVRCDYVSGNCPEAAGSRCQTGWTGDSCNQVCSGGYGLNCASLCITRQCQGSQDCNQVTGKCTEGCRPGYIGEDCTHKCPIGRYGSNCSQLCVDSYGIGCTSKCSDRHCAGSQGCDHVTGLCSDGCVLQYGGDDCTQDCSNGYGKYCELNCDERKCSGNQDCNMTTGRCIEGCMAGYQGVACTQECPSGNYGLDCRQNCNNRHCRGNPNCNHTTGRCMEGCSPGYQGTDCTQSCHESYGEDCGFQCKDRHCNGSEECDHLTGKCLDGCDAGYSTDDCIKSMKFGFKKFYTCHCKSGEFCNFTTGLCPGNCSSGWSGPSCQRQNVALNKDASQIQTRKDRPASLAVDGESDIFTPDTCIDTGSIDNPWWRVDLRQTYPIRDINIVYRDTFLHRLIGFIIHVEAETGQNTTCYQHTGNISSLSYNYDVQCSSTIYGRYVTLSVPRKVFILLCEIEVYVCSMGTYGAGCTDFCHCAGNVRCDYLTGRCPGNICQTGWTGSSCNQECDDGYYGSNCTLVCSQRFCLNDQASCDNVDGSCGGDCQTDYEGKDCTVTKLPTEDTTEDYTEDYTKDKTVMIASTVSVLVIVAIIMTIIIIVKTRKRCLLQKGNLEVNLELEGKPKVKTEEDSNVRPTKEFDEHDYERLEKPGNVYQEINLKGNPEISLKVKLEINLEGKPEMKLEGKPEVNLEEKPEVNLKGKPEVNQPYQTDEEDDTLYEDVDLPNYLVEDSNVRPTVELDEHDYDRLEKPENVYQEVF